MTFDYVIVGAGSAGCVVAERLSRDGRSSVALLEAGPPDRNPWIHIPLGYGKTFYDPAINWMYRAEPDPGLGGRIDYWPRGKVLGGSSSINAMVWIRGDQRDFDGWAAAGASGWSWADVLPWFKAIEHNASGADAWRGADGPLHIADVSRALHPLAALFLEAAMQAGFAPNPDFNGATQEGVGVYQITTRGGRRESSARAFLAPASGRAALTVLTATLATKIRLDGRRAVGVEALRRGVKVTIAARREVILCAGAINSPQLLQLSGIGPAELLAHHGIEVAQDHPAVGAHLQDHLGINSIYRSRQRTLNDVLRPWWGKLGAGARYLARRDGPISLSLNQGGGFVRTRPELDRPDIQLYFQPITTMHASAGTRPLLTPDAFPGFALGFSTCHPTSRGTVMIRSHDPSTAPHIRPGSLATEEDRQTAIDGLKLLRRIAAQPAMHAVIEAELAPGPEVQGDEALLADFRARCGTVYHPVGTCRIGEDKASSVVDPRLRVHGIDGLRVIDTSVFPAIISGNTNAATVMVGAKGADMVAADGN